MLASGDLTNNGYQSEYAALFNSVKKPMLWAAGNHDQYYSNTTEVMGRPNSFYQRVGNIGVFVLTSFDNNVELFNKTLINNLNDSEVDHQFVIVHYSPCTTGAPTPESKPESDYLLEILENNPAPKLRAVISGHSHLFNLFNKSNVFFILPSPSGGKDELYFSDDFVGKRYFSSFKTGPLEPVDEYS